MSDTAIINRALELVRDGLRSGAIPAHNFDMTNWFDEETWNRGGKFHCRTAACIGGWTDLLLERAGHERIRIGENQRLANLFLLNTGGSIPHLTPTEAAHAIDRYLAGKQPWGRS